MKTFKRIDCLEAAVRRTWETFFDRKIVACDVATDHGYIAEKLSKQNYVEKVYATDISEKSLQKLKNLIEFHKYLNIFAFFGDGLNPIESADICVIAGIGGFEIIKILSTQNTAHGKNKCDFFVLAPSHNVIQLRRFLAENHIFIFDDHIIEDEGKFYPIITVCVSKKQFLRKSIFNIWLGRDNNLSNDDFIKFLMETDFRLSFLDGVNKKRIKSDKILYQKFKLRKLVKKLLKRRNLC